MQEDLIYLQAENIKNDEEALKYLSQKLLDEGAVKESFAASVLAREKLSPTGLKFGDYAVAIPHTDSEHVNHTRIALMTLKSAVPFSEMAGEGGKVNVNLIVMLAIKEAHSQVDMLLKLIELLQDGETVRKILGATSEQKKEILRILSTHKII